MGWQKYRTLTDLVLVCGMLLGTRLLYLLSPAGRVGDADESVFGLMALRIMSLQEFPLYCWGAHYAGTPVSYIAALIFNFTGPGYLALRAAMLPFSLISMVCFYFIYRKLFGRWKALVGVSFLVFCPFIVLRYTMAALGGYGETMLGCGLIILLSWNILESPASGWRDARCFALGLACGFFFYVLFLVTPAIAAFALTTLFRLERRRGRAVALFCGGGLVGLMPLIVYNVVHPGATLIRSAGRSLDAGKEALSASLPDLLRHCIGVKAGFTVEWLRELPFILGEYVLPPECGRLALLCAGLVVALLLMLFVAGTVRERRAAWGYLPFQFALLIVILLAFLWVGNLSRVRHMMPLMAILPVAVLWLAGRVGGAGPAVVAGLVLCGLFQVAGWRVRFREECFDPAPVTALLQREGIAEIYGSYWTVYPIAFAARGEIAVAPAMLPFNETYSDRLPEQTERVKRSAFPAYVFAKREEKLRSEFCGFMEVNGILCRTAGVNNAWVYYKLSKPVSITQGSDGRTVFLHEYTR